MTTLSAAPLPSLGPYKNDIHVSTKLTAAPNGATIFGAMPDGRILLYNANVDSFTISRQDSTALKGAIAASGFGYYMVDHYLLNDSLVQYGPGGCLGGYSSGFRLRGPGWLIRQPSPARARDIFSGCRPLLPPCPCPP